MKRLARHLLPTLVLAVAGLIALGCGGDGSPDQDEAVRALAAIREAEERFYEDRDRYTERFPDLQLIGPAGVSGSLQHGIETEIDTSSNQELVTVQVRTTDGEFMTWFSLLRGKDYGSGFEGSAGGTVREPN